MDKEKNILSVLNMDRIVFDKIEFKRIGFSSDEELKLEIQANISRNEEDVYRVMLIVNGLKPDEYTIEISLSGFFSFNESADEISEELKSSLINKNAIAILMPYLRSEVSLLTAQPGMECVVLPAFNISSMLTK